MPKTPLLFQLNTRMHLFERSELLGRPCTLDDIDDQLLDRLSIQGFQWLWALGVWQTGERGRAISAGSPSWREEFTNTLADLEAQDIIGSPFAVRSYTLDEALGDRHALSRLRARCHVRGLRLMLDFVPNHLAIDHPWVQTHPERFIQGDEQQLEQAPENYFRATPDGPIFAHGRDPYFPGWPDTIQLDYQKPEVQDAMKEQLLALVQHCDGLRCDMAMLLLPDVFARTWSASSVQDFWPAAIEAARSARPDFCFMAEVYWDLEWTLQQEGFDYCYDKRLYDRLLHKRAQPVRAHLLADAAYQRASVRFLENHDEPRIAQKLELAPHKAAAVVTYLVPGLGFVHEGQAEGWSHRANIHLRRRRRSKPDRSLMRFYERLMQARLRPSFQGDFRLLSAREAWAQNNSHESFIGFLRAGPQPPWMLVVVNYSAHASQCYLPLPIPRLEETQVELRDLLSSATYLRDGAKLRSEGLYLDLQAWSHHVFELHPSA